MPLSVLQKPRAYRAGEPVFCLAKDGWFIGSAVVTVDALDSAPDVRIGYIVPDASRPIPANPAFAELLRGLYGTSAIGIEESVPMSSVVPMSELRDSLAAGPAELSCGTIVVSLRKEPYRVQLAQLLEPFVAKTASARLIMPVGSELTVSGAQTELHRESFLTVSEYEAAILASYDAAQDGARWTYIPAAATT